MKALSISFTGLLFLITLFILALLQMNLNQRPYFFFFIFIFIFLLVIFVCIVFLHVKNIILFYSKAIPLTDKQWRQEKKHIYFKNITENNFFLNGLKKPHIFISENKVYPIITLTKKNSRSIILIQNDLLDLFTYDRLKILIQVGIDDFKIKMTVIKQISILQGMVLYYMAHCSLKAIDSLVQLIPFINDKYKKDFQETSRLILYFFFIAPLLDFIIKIVTVIKKTISSKKASQKGPFFESEELHATKRTLIHHSKDHLLAKFICELYFV